MLIAGPTSCGKTVLLKRILENRIIRPVPDRVVWYYKIWQPAYAEMLNVVPGISFKEGLPVPDDLMREPETPRLFVLDDLMTNGMENKEVSSMFCEGSHHYNYSVCILVQNLFYGGKMQRTISLNCQYMAVFKNPRERYQITVLSRQAYPNASHKLLKAYEEATDRPHGYLFIDFKQDTPEEQRLVKSLFRDERVLHNTQLRCLQSPQLRSESDESVWDTYYDYAVEELPDDATDEDIVEEMMTFYRTTLLKIHSLQKSDKHRTMMKEFSEMSKYLSPEEAARLVVRRNRALIEDVLESSIVSDESL